jgi:hypothetical protein
MVLKKNERMGGFENVWHSDVTWRLQPSLGSVLLAREVPAVGGDTLFSDMYAAYDGLDDALRESIDGLHAIHDFTRTFGALMSADELAKKREEFPPARHPVVRTHPETGRKGLYVNAAFTDYIVGIEPEKSRRPGLYSQAVVPDISAASAGAPSRSRSGTTAPCSTTRRRTTPEPPLDGARDHRRRHAGLTARPRSAARGADAQRGD